MASHPFRVTLHDRGSFLVPSRRNPEEAYIVDIEESPWTCTCEGYMFRCSGYENYACWHIRYIAKLLGVKLPIQKQLTTTHNYNG